MDRRRFVGTAGAIAVSGCLGSGSGGDAASTRTPPNCESAGERHVTVADSASVPADAEVEIDATMERERVTAESTARLTVELRNVGRTRETSVADEHNCHFFNRGAGWSEPRGLWLHRRADAPETRADGCWSRDLSPDKPADFVSVGCGTRPIEPGESVATTYEVWDDYTVSEYLSPGTYRFSQRVSLWPPTADGESADEADHRFEWWLDLDVE